MKRISAILYMFSFCMILPFGDALVRVLTENGMSVPQVIWVRSLVIISILFPFLWRQKDLKLAMQLWPSYALRSLFFFFAVFFWLSVLKYVELPQLYSVGFTAPILASIASVFVLKERLNKRKILGLIGGFIGTLIIIRPGFSSFNLYLLVPLFCAFNWAGAMVISKKLSKTESPLKLTFYLSSSFIVLTSPMLFSNWTQPSLFDGGILILMGVLVLLSHLALLKAYQKAELSVLAPIEFSTLIFASLFSWLFFKEIADFWTYIGGTVIFLSAMLAILKSRQKKALQDLKWTPEQ